MMDCSRNTATSTSSETTAGSAVAPVNDDKVKLPHKVRDAGAPKDAASYVESPTDMPPPTASPPYHLFGLPRDVLRSHVSLLLSPHDVPSLLTTCRDAAAMARGVWRAKLGHLLGTKWSGEGGDEEEGEEEAEGTSRTAVGWKREYRRQYYLKRSLHKGLFRCHSAKVNVLAAMDDDTFLSASRDGMLKLWNVRTGAFVCEFKGHTGVVNGVAKIDSTSFVSCAGDQMDKPTAKLWDLNTGICLRSYIGHTDDLTSVAKMSENTFVTASADVTAKLWDLHAGRCVQTFLGGGASGLTSVVKVNDEVIATANQSGSIFVWNFLTGHRLHAIADVHQHGNAALHGFDSETFLSSSRSGELKRWNVVTGECVGTFDLNFQADEIFRIHGQVFVCASFLQNILELWDLVAGQAVHTFSLDRPISSVARIDEVTFILGHLDGTAKICKIPAESLADNIGEN